jgi:alpha-glucosidase
MDSNDDGVGDLQGIKSKLPYLKDLGIDGVWLSPIYKSPMADHGYDISDFRDIHDEFGTMKDFDDLLNECTKLGLKLVLDFVPNHSSDEHEWFKKSEQRIPGYEDFYIWHPGKIDNATQVIVPPNNWLSGFRHSGWRWSDVRKEMYYHMFHHKQPDLNYRNPRVVQEMKDILTFWLNKGVAGFRVDAIPHL